MPYEFTVSDFIPASPRDIYDAWLDSAGHAAMTGAEATASPVVGAPFSAWDGYIWGENLKLEPGRLIVRSWRTSEFASEGADSQIEVLLEPIENGTKITIHHSNVPDGQTGYENGGWQENYFDPMKEYFSIRSR